MFKALLRVLNTYKNATMSWNTSETDCDGDQYDDDMTWIETTRTCKLYPFDTLVWQLDTTFRGEVLEQHYFGIE